MAIIGIDHVVIRVKDIEEAIASYRALGLELTRQTENPAEVHGCVCSCPCCRRGGRVGRRRQR